MGKLRKTLFRSAIRLSHIFLPREVRKDLILVLLHAADESDHRQTIRELLNIRDSLDALINQKCIDWGEGVHIKHKLMDGIHTFFTDRIPHGSEVLDVGCGIGAVAYDIAELSSSHVTAIDTNEKSLSFAKNRFKHPNLEFLHCDVTLEDLPDTVVNIVVLSSVLEHLPNRITLLQKIVNKYQPSLFLIRVPTFERHFFAALKRELDLFPYTDKTHLLEYSPKSFLDEMEQAGLNVRYLEVRWGDIWAECTPIE